MSDIEVQGINELKRMLRDVLPKKAKRAIHRGTQAGCTLILGTARRLIPEVPRKDRYGLETIGQLRAAVTVRRIGANRKGWSGNRVVIQGEGLDYKGDLFYGAFVEYGTQYMNKREYLKKASDMRQESAINIARTIIRNELTR